MPTKVTAYDLLISCPSDVAEFVPDIEKTISRFNAIYGKEAKIVIRPVYWEKSSFPESGGHPQNLLNQQIVDGSDMAISLFWSRFGQPTLHNDSGTEEEIEYMLAEKKQVFLYFIDQPLSPSKIDFEQYQKITKFKERYKTSGLYFTVIDKSELCDKFYDHLKLYFNKILYGNDIRKKAVNKCILWVDDRPENNVYERRAFEEYGIDILIALSTQQALSFLRNNDSISLIISDMGRKEGPQEGYVLLDAVRKTDPKIPFYIFAGSKSPKHVEEAYRRGAQGCTNNAYELIDMVIKSMLKP